MRLSAKIEDPNIAPKTYWSILNRFLSNKKIPNKHPILVDGKSASNFAEEVKLLSL